MHMASLSAASPVQHGSLYKNAYIDTRCRAAAEGAFVVTFGRAGEDNKKFKLGDADVTLQGFAGADYDLQVPRPYLSCAV